MGKMKRIELVITAAVMLLESIIMLTDPTSGYHIVTLILSASLLLFGIRMLTYYLFMGRHMVGGRTILFIAVIGLDFGLFTMTLSDMPRFYVVLYLLGINALSGAVEIMRARESRSYGASSWKFTMTHGTVNIAIAVLSLVFIGNTNMLVYMYSLGLIYSAIMRIIRAVRRTAIIYVN